MVEMGSMVGSDLVKAMGAEATATPDQQDIHIHNDFAGYRLRRRTFRSIVRDLVE
jgi:hypothetical protein